MRITKYESRFFKKFVADRISRFKMAMTSRIQVIVGTNGCGKTSLMKDFTPDPPARPMFLDDGSRYIQIMHDGHVFDISSDFGNKNGAHSFRMDGQELNPSGTTNVQSDLIRSHLGYTDTLRKILTNSIPFATMTPEQRKVLLIELNPFGLGFILDHHKRILSAIRACKNNLSMLAERKAILENDLLDVDALASLRTEQASLTTFFSTLIEYHHRIVETIRQIKSSITPKQTNAYEACRTAGILRKQVKNTIAFVDIPRDHPHDYLADLKSQMRVVESQKETVSIQIVAISEEISRYEHYLEECNNQDLITDLEHQMQDARAEMSRLEPDLVKSPYSLQILEQCPRILDRLQEHLTTLIGLSKQIESPRKIEAVRQKYHRYKAISDGYKYNLDHLRDKQFAVEKEFSADTQTIPEPCAKSACFLFQRYTSQNQKLEAEYQRLAEEIRRIDHKYQRCSAYVDALKQYLDDADVYLPTLSAITDLFGEYHYLKAPVNDLNFLDSVRSDPLFIYRKILTYCENSHKTHQYSTLTKKYDHLQQAHQKASSPKDLNAEFVQTLLDEKRQQRDEILVQFDGYDRQGKSLKSQIDLVTEYLDLREKVDVTRDDLAQCLDAAYKRAEIDGLEAMHELLTEERSRVAARIGEIEQIIKTQEILYARYTEEITSQIGAIEAKRTKFSAVEKALAGILTRYTVNFINALIQNMNYFIKRVFSTPYVIKPLDPKKPVDYIFPVISGDARVPDLKEGSSAQVEITNLVFCLACIVQGHYEDYPIFLDEIGKTFDPYHKQQLLTLLQSLIDEDIVSQIFLINHHAAISDGLANSEVLVLNDMNVMVTSSNSNKHVEITRY